MDVALNVIVYVIDRFDEDYFLSFIILYIEYSFYVTVIIK